MHAQRSFRTVFAAIFGLGVGLTSFNAHGQIKPLAQREVGLALDSGLVQNQQPLRTTIFMEEVVVSDSPWVRLRFAEVTLGEAPPGGQPTILRITSRLDGAVQIHFCIIFEKITLRARCQCAVEVRFIRMHA